MTRRQNLDRKAEQLGLKVFTWSPGDGTTRYRFSAGTSESYHHEDGLFTALGLHEAEVFLKGYALGRLYK